MFYNVTFMNNLPQFSFRTDRYDFWPIYEALRKFYPIGIKKIHEKGIFYKYPGILALEKLIVENLHDQSNYQKRWKDKTDKWSGILNKKIIGTTYGQEPSFSAYIEIQKTESNNRVFEKKLHFAVSLLGPFYTIFAIDSTNLVEKDFKLSEKAVPRDSHYPAVHRTIISPYGEFAEIFEQLRGLIEEDFENYRFVPQRIHSSVIEGLYVRYGDDSFKRIYHGLFNQLFDFNSILVGDEYKYGFDQWYVDNPNMDNYWVVGPPTSSKK